MHVSPTGGHVDRQHADLARNSAWLDRAVVHKDPLTVLRHTRDGDIEDHEPPRVRDRNSSPQDLGMTRVRDNLNCLSGVSARVAEEPVSAEPHSGLCRGLGNRGQQREDHQDRNRPTTSVGPTTVGNIIGAFTEATSFRTFTEGQALHWPKPAGHRATPAPRPRRAAGASTSP
jgi:hypothetical protein